MYGNTELCSNIGVFNDRMAGIIVIIKEIFRYVHALNTYEKIFNLQHEF